MTMPELAEVFTEVEIGVGRITLKRPHALRTWWLRFSPALGPRVRTLCVISPSGCGPSWRALPRAYLHDL
jgi:hypothetical protein